MGCIKLTYSESLRILKVVSNNLKISVKSYAGDYRYGFQGMEKDDEIKNEGNSYDFGARMYDSRVGRWLSLDPLARKQPNQSPYKSMLNNPIVYIDPDGRTEYETVIYKDEKSGTQIKVYRSISNKTMTDGRVKNEPGGYFVKPDLNYQSYYDFRNVTTYTLKVDGTVAVDKATEILYRNGEKYKDYVLFDAAFGTTAESGDIYDPDDSFVQSGGFYMTGGQGQGTKYHSENVDYVGNIDKLVSILNNYKAGASFNIPKSMKDASFGWEGLDVLIKAIDKQGGIIDKIWEQVDTYKSDTGTGSGSMGPSNHIIYSNKTTWDKPKGAKDNTGYRYRASDEEIKRGDTVGGNHQVDVFPKK